MVLTYMPVADTAFVVLDSNGQAVAAVGGRRSPRTALKSLPSAAGRFTVRLHDSAKRAIAIWNGDSGITGWVPASNSEVRQ